MSAVDLLTKADEKMAAQIHAVANFVESIGSHTILARERLTLALDAARKRLGVAMRDIATQVGLTLDVFGNAAGCDMLTLPEPEPTGPNRGDDPILDNFGGHCSNAAELNDEVKEDAAILNKLGVETPAQPGEDRAWQEDAAVLHRQLTAEEADKAWESAPEVPISEERINQIVNYAVNGGPHASPMPLDEALADPAAMVAGMTETVAVHTSNGKTRKRGRKS